MIHKRFFPIAVAAAILAVAAPALAGSGRPTEVQVEQLGPKHLLGTRVCHGAQYVTLETHQRCPRARFVTVATHSIPITLRTLDVEELGPKHLLH
jgi:hypothetical protein